MQHAYAVRISYSNGMTDRIVICLAETHMEALNIAWSYISDEVTNITINRLVNTEIVV